MNEATAQALHRINQRFYEQQADAFAASRNAPWPGWERILALLGSSLRNLDDEHRPSILDLGCGNGRFAAYLGQQLESGCSYVGVDSSAALLSAARRDLASTATARFIHHDLLSGLPANNTFSPASFQLIGLFGLLHHIPGFERRRMLVASLVSLLAHRGLLALSFWQFGDRDRFRRRFIPWEEHNRAATERIDRRELEEGDHLLSWGDMTAATDRLSRPRRYCHFAGEDEALRLIEDLPLTLVERFYADGRGGDLNLYLLLTTT